MSGLKHSCCMAAIMVGCMPVMAFAQENTESETQEVAREDSNVILVSATRRDSDVSSIPYNISAVGSEQLNNTGVTDVQSLSRQVPNLSIGSNGNQNLAQQIPIIRGLNATSTSKTFSRGEAPVAVYLGNVQNGNYFLIDDVARVEVLRGPQGTLFGGGALGGTLRIIPTDPKLGVVEGRVQGSVGLVSHSNDIDYSLGGMLNFPLGETLALRVSGKYQVDAGYVDTIVFQQEDGALSPAVRSDPSDYNSPAILQELEDYNESEATSVRAALRWEPTLEFDATLAFNYTGYDGVGIPTDQAGYPGGTLGTIDPRIAIPARGEYEDVTLSEAPWERDSYMASLDMSYDLGFATLSSTSSYFYTDSETVSPGAIGLSTTAFAFYYMGSPAFPRFVLSSVFADQTENWTQELRLVSPGGDLIDYTFGAFYQHQTTKDRWTIFLPGSYEYGQDALADPVFFDALMANYAMGDFFSLGIPGYGALPPDGISQDKRGTNTFEQFAGYGEVTLNPTDTLHITGGARVFHQKFRRDNTEYLPLFAGLSGDSTFSNSLTDAIFKANVSWDFAPDNMAYVTFSQGFRRGGRNSIPLDGPFQEPAVLQGYVPDQVDNYEIGVKGRVSGWRYNFDFFYDDWSNVQIDTSTEYNVWPVVVNGGQARSYGIEAELSGYLTDELSVNLGYAYAKATIREDFCVPSSFTDFAVDPPALITVDCALQGIKGSRLPGAPQHSGSGTLTYLTDLNDTDTFGATLNVNYRGSVLTALPTQADPNAPIAEDFFLVNANLSYGHGPWTISLYGRNIFDKRGTYGVIELGANSAAEPLSVATNVTTPRQVGLNLSYDF